nr:uncharacterized protein LOC106678706 [Halyomorpha halys]
MAMTSAILLFAAVFVGASGGKYYFDDTNLEENENLIEPKLDPWQIFNKPKGKSTLKNLILSFQKYESKRKLVSAKEKNNFRQPEEVTTTTKAETTSTKSDDIILGQVYPSLHQQTEGKNKFEHSIVDGWVF